MPRVPASPRGAASPAIPLARHLSIHAHKPGSETPVFESLRVGVGSVPLPPSYSGEPLGAGFSRWSWGVWLKPQMESPEGGTGFHLLEAAAWRAEVMPEEGKCQRPTVWGWESKKVSLRLCDVCLKWCRWGN